jgi:magnesium-transporting ATPase (P-type)
MGDLLFNFTEWLRNTPLNDLALTISESAPTMWIGEHFYAIPIFQVIHILAIAASFSAVLMINARLLKLAGHSTLEETTSRYVRVIWWSLLVLILSGALMIVGEPIREFINAVFWIKMALVVIAILFTIWFHKGLARRFAGNAEASMGAKLAGITLVILWCMIMTGGRWIAYNPG